MSSPAASSARPSTSCWNCAWRKARWARTRPTAASTPGGPLAPSRRPEAPPGQRDTWSMDADDPELCTYEPVDASLGGLVRQRFVAVFEAEPRRRTVSRAPTYRERYSLARV